MVKAKLVDKTLVIKLLTQSFKDNQSVNYIVRHTKNRLKHIEALMDYSFEMCSIFGDVWISDDRKACALVLYPDEKRTTLKAIILDLKVILMAIGISGVRKAIDREARIKAKQPKLPMAYLWFIGVDPSAQHKGTGTRLLQEVIADSRKKKLPIFLETSTVSNIPWYEHNGFKVYEELNLTYTLYFLKN
ncbi:N-acetyltransferase [Mucilaginibacter sp.]|jgi:GNAT superfamily N-acetyltransferase|uniref:GNAT family N-acetyltransferase n=1 Tax=Mucilaginibacter sp. TaxID=1882438 RepID=UPI0026163477|nr:GNAT family N-acetyltransferase [Mucilaginibacter sp.]MDB4926579.1 GCN5-related N-acetyltransferase [Mucilaginibacter sp.]